VFGASAASFVEAEVLTIAILWPESQQKLVALAPVLLLAVLLVSWSGTERSGVNDVGVVRRQLRSGMRRSGGKAGKSASHHPGKGREFHGATHGLASGAGSDGRVKGATLARAVKLGPRGRAVRRRRRRELCAPKARRLESRPR
jgi:hypothetical protein